MARSGQGLQGPYCFIFPLHLELTIRTLKCFKRKWNPKLKPYKSYSLSISYKIVSQLWVIYVSFSSWEILMAFIVKGQSYCERPNDTCWVKVRWSLWLRAVYGSGWGLHKQKTQKFGKIFQMKKFTSFLCLFTVSKQKQIFHKKYEILKFTCLLLACSQFLKNTKLV